MHYVKTLPNFIDKQTCMWCVHTHMFTTHILHIHIHTSQNRKWVKCRLLPAEKSRPFAIYVTGLNVAEVPKAPPTSVNANQSFPGPGSIDKAPSGHLLTGTKILWGLNRKDLLSEASISQSHPSPRGQGTKILISYGNYKVNQ